VNILRFTVLFIFCLVLPTGVLADTPPTEKQIAKPAVKAETAKPAVKAETAKPAAKAEKAKPATMAKVETAKPVTPVKAEPAKKKANKVATSANKNAKKPKAPAKAKKKKPEGLVIGKNLKVGMPLKEAIKLLGLPGSMKIQRGTESKLDSISIEYANHGIVIHSLNGKRQIEALEILPTFKGSFAKGVKMGAKVAAMIDKYGVPQSMNDSLAKYPKRGMYFSLKENVLISAHVFAKNSKLLSHQLYKSH